MIQIVVTSIHYFFLFFQRQDADYEYESDYPAQDESEAALGLPSDSRSIRDNIVDEFTCDGKKKMNFTNYLQIFQCINTNLYKISGRPYGYYADVANECQIFHICYPVVYADGEEEMFKWSFICPNGTIFDQVNTLEKVFKKTYSSIQASKWIG